jgi:hypothetical protein
MTREEAERIGRAINEAGLSIREWARMAGRCHETVRLGLREHGITIDPKGARRGRGAGLRQYWAATRTARHAAAINAERKRITASVAAHRRPAAPPSAAEAEAAVAAFLARGGRVTVCPPAAVAPIHNGDGWR